MRASGETRGDCPLAPPSRTSTYSRALHRACLVVGGHGALAQQLKVPKADLLAWMQAVEEPPFDVFLAAVEVILLHAADAGRAS